MGAAAERCLTGKAVFGNTRRAYRVVIGGPALYRVEPLNPLKKKDRGRRCFVVEYDGRAGLVQVLFEATKTRAWIEPGDLVPDMAGAGMPEVVVVRSERLATL